MALLWIAAACGVVGLVVGRWKALAVPLVVWCGLAVFLVLNDGWYGNGWGEYGVEWNVVVAAITVATTAIGVALRRAASPRRGRRRPSQAVRDQ